MASNSEYEQQEFWKNIDNEIELSKYYLFDCIRRQCLNAFIDESLVSKHPLYTMDEYRLMIFKQAILAKYEQLYTIIHNNMQIQINEYRNKHYGN